MVFESAMGLPKSYARYSWWIYEKPIINHPDRHASSSGFIPIEDLEGRKRFYRSLVTSRNTCSLFPPDCIIDTELHRICRLVDGQLIPLGVTQQTFWP